MIENKYEIDCYENDKIKSVIKFVPETEPIEEPISEKIYGIFFPKMIKIDYTKLKISNIGIYSITKPNITKKICKFIVKYTKTKNITVTDAFSNVGGMAIMFAYHFSKVNSCEIMPLHCKIIENNLNVYGLRNKVNLICDDYMKVMTQLKQEVIFLDPPWGGKDYDRLKKMSLFINNINIACIIKYLIKTTKYIFIQVPFNYDFNYFKRKISKLPVQIVFHPLMCKNTERMTILIVVIVK